MLGRAVCGGVALPLELPLALCLKLPLALPLALSLLLLSLGLSLPPAVAALHGGRRSTGHERCMRLQRG